MSKQMFLLACAAAAVCAAGSAWSQTGNVTVYRIHSSLTSGASTPTTAPNVIAQSGYNTAGDGGWAEYDWNPLSTAAADGVMVILPSGQSSGTAGRYMLRTSNGINLKAFGARCNGTMDDTAAIQSWLNVAGPGVKLVAPAGTCNFSSPLTVGAVSHYTIEGAGPSSTTFNYVGPNATAALLTLNPANAGVLTGITLSNIRLQSQTTMTGGYAIQANGLYDSNFLNITLDGINQGNGNLCGGLWLNGVSNIEVFAPNISSQQNCGDGLLVNSTSLVPGGAEIRVESGSIGGVTNASSNTVNGFINGVHMAGGFGGLRCDNTDIHSNGVGWLVDEAVYNAANRDLHLGSTCAIDSSGTAGLQLNQLDGSPVAIIRGWVSSTQQGHGIYVQAWKGYLNIDGDMLYNNCGDGLYDAGASTNIFISASSVISGNGTNLGTGCATWQGSNPHGYGLDASSAVTTIYSVAKPVGNTSGPYSANTGVSALLTTSGNQTVSSSGGTYFIANDKGGGAAGLALESSGTPQWNVDETPGLSQFRIVDRVNATNWLSVTAGGNAALGESSNNVLTIHGSALTTGYPIPGLPSCNSSNKGLFAFVTNGQATPSYLGAVSTIGTTVAPVFCNGTNWVYH